MFSKRLRRKKIKKLWFELPEGMRYKPASEEEILDFESSFSEVPEPYKWFLKECGSGVVGSEWLDGIHELRDSHKKFLNEEWSSHNNFLIGWDGGGSPISLTSNGTVVVEYLGVQDIQIIAKSLEDFIMKGLSLD